jgi:plasmid stability protein
VHLVPDGLRLPLVLAGGEHEEIRVAAHGSHVENEDVLRQLLLGEAGDTAGVFQWRQGLVKSSRVRS